MKLRDIAHISIFAALIAVCTWIAIPAPIPFTMQTFAVFASLGMLGGKRGTVAVLMYLFLGAVGLPVFSGFRGGIGAIMGPTGGYMAGFVAICLIYWAAEHFWGNGTAVMAVSFIIGLALLYGFGSIWFMRVYAQSGESIGFWAVVSQCVLPFVLPDIAKLSLALIVTRRVRGALGQRVY